MLRARLGVEMEACPPYLHQRNGYVEGLIRILKIGIRARLKGLVGKLVNDVRIKDATPYFNFAAEHKCQSLNSTRCRSRAGSVASCMRVHVLST